MKKLFAKLVALNDKLPRLIWWLAAAIALSAVVLLIVPSQVTVTLYKVSLLALAVVAGYHIDRCVFPYARPHQVLTDHQLHELSTPLQVTSTGAALFNACCYRRAIIIAATMISTAVSV
jgi:hypothetical protein